jgi:hypothetical protein
VTESNNVILCYFCGSARIKPSLSQRAILFSNEKFRFVFCKDCHGFSLYPKLSDNQLFSMYSSDYVDQGQDDEIASDESLTTRFSDLEKYLEKSKKADGKLFLDYGCGANPPTFQLARKNGYIPYGMELSADVRKIAELNTGEKLFSKEEIQNGDQLFDVIFLGDVLEHLVDPIVELRFLQTKLAFGGALLAQGPLQGAKTLTHLCVRLFGWISRKRVSTYPPYHVSLASSQSMRSLLKSSDLQLINLKIFEVAWPVPSFSELMQDFTIRNQILFVTKQIDKVLAKVLLNYGTRYFLASATNGSK